MSPNSLLSRVDYHVRELRADNPLPLPDITPTTWLDYRGLGLSSVQVLTIVVKLEDELDFEVSEDRLDISKLQTVSDMLLCFEQYQD